MFPLGATNRVICFSGPGARSAYMTLAIDGPADLHFGASVDGYEQIPLYTYSDHGNRADNITDWGLEQFRRHYQAGRAKPKRPITKETIFHYVYSVLHDPAYREKYALNLKREFPRMPFYAEFWVWAAWGKELMDLHLGYEQVVPAKLKRTDRTDDDAKAAGGSPKVLLKADKEAGRIRVDSETTIAGIPAEAWEYKLGNRSALEWILDQYKEKKPKDATVREKFNTYRFADHKEKVIELLARVTTVSAETVRIVEGMRGAQR
jgi:predicted helicase